MGMSHNKIHYINLNGEITKEIVLEYGKRELCLRNSFALKQKKWILV